MYFALKPKFSESMLAEVVAFVNHNKVVGCPVQLAQISFTGKPLFAA